MSEGRTQRARDVEVATAGFRIDIGGAAASVAPVDAKQSVADPDVATDPIEFLPGRRTVDIKVGAKSQWIDPDAPLLL